MSLTSQLFGGSGQAGALSTAFTSTPTSDDNVLGCVPKKKRDPPPTKDIEDSSTKKKKRKRSSESGETERPAKRSKKRKAAAASDDDEDLDLDDDEAPTRGAGQATRPPRKKKQKQPTEVDEEDKLKRTLFVSNLPVGITHQRLAKVFKAEAGSVVSARIRSVAYADQNSSRKYNAHNKTFDPRRRTCNGYVVFESREVARKGLALHNREYEGHHLMVDWALGDSSEFKGGTTIFLGNLPLEVSEETIIQFFHENDVGPVQRVRVPRNTETNLGRGIGFVAFATNHAEMVEKALTLNGKELDGREVRITVTTKSTKRQRSAEGRGGRGGRGARGGEEFGGRGRSNSRGRGDAGDASTFSGRGRGRGDSGGRRGGRRGASRGGRGGRGRSEESGARSWQGTNYHVQTKESKRVVEKLRTPKPQKKSSKIKARLRTKGNLFGTTKPK